MRRVEFRIVSIIMVLIMSLTVNAQAFAVKVGGDVSDISLPAELDEYFDSACLVELDSDTVLYKKNTDVPFMPVGSAVNLIAAYTAVNEMDISGEITVSEEVEDISSGARNMGLVAGNRYSVKDLLAGMVVAGAQDAAVAVAYGAAGSEEEFVKLINRQAANIGLSSSVYSNARGGNDSEQYTTIDDYVMLCRAVLSNDIISELAGMKEYEVSDGTRLVHRLDIMDPGSDSYDERISGLGGGVTDRAGINIALTAEQNGMNLLFVGHKSEEHGDMCTDNAVSIMEYYWDNCQYMDISETVEAMLAAESLPAEDTELHMLISASRLNDISDSISIGETYEAVDADGETCRMVDVLYKEKLLSSVKIAAQEMTDTTGGKEVKEQPISEIPFYTMDDWKGKDRELSLTEKYGFYIITGGTVFLAAAVLGLAYGLRRKGPRR